MYTIGLPACMCARARAMHMTTITRENKCALTHANARTYVDL